MEYTNRAVADAGGAAESLLVVVWNAHVGAGDLAGLIADLRSGTVTGSPEHRFVLLLQEVHRAGAAVPASVPEWGQVARRSGDDEGGRPDVVRVAREQGLSLLYAPSMRNGADDDGGPPEDRGNAILSSLPLANPTLIELPWERQRRVAVAATVVSRTRDGRDWQVRMISAHLDNRARFGQIHRSFGAARLRQASELARVFSGPGPAVLGADLNTWEAGAEAGAVRALREAFPLPESIPDRPTAPLPWILPDLQLDYMMFRLPEGWEGGYRVLDGTWGSDHRPLVGRIRIGEPVTEGASASG